jgi:hypothetical protein
LGRVGCRTVARWGVVWGGRALSLLGGGVVTQESDCHTWGSGSAVWAGCSRGLAWSCCCCWRDVYGCCGYFCVQRPTGQEVVCVGSMHLWIWCRVVWPCCLIKLYMQWQARSYLNQHVSTWGCCGTSPRLLWQHLCCVSLVLCVTCALMVSYTSNSMVLRVQAVLVHCVWV